LPGAGGLGTVRLPKNAAIVANCPTSKQSRRDAAESAKLAAVRPHYGGRRLAEPIADRTSVRSLAPLPGLETVVFFRKANRDFVTGRGPLAVAVSLRVRRWLGYAMWVFLVVGGAISLVAGALSLLGRDVAAGYVATGACLLFLGLVYSLLLWFVGRRAAKEQRLASEGALLPAELVSVKYRSGDNGSSTLKIEYRFQLPDGRPMTGKQALSRFDFRRKQLPPPGSKLLLLYVDEQLHEAL
jgi:hypothetical protein